MIRSPPFFKLLAFIWVISLSHSPAFAYYGHGSSALRHYQHGPSKKYCQNLLQRREWYVSLSSPRTQLIFCPCRRRTLADSEKTSYITAVKCMQSLPALHDQGEAVRTRFDEFQALHIEVADRVHATVSLCWHKIAVERIYSKYS